MKYTVKKLAALSGVSVRTLRFYDEIGLLKPAYYGENQYRYYENEQLLMLQQILFYRELGFSLSDIQSVMGSAGFDKIQALQSHKIRLENQLHHTQQLISTLDQTITYLKGESQMNLETIFEGFNLEKQKHYEDFLVKEGIQADQIQQVRDKIRYWGKDQWELNKQTADQIHAELILAIQNQLSPESKTVQAIIHRHYEMTKQFWIPNRESYIGLSQLYASHPDFIAFYQKLHPQLLNFLMQAMQIYAEQTLKPSK